MTEPEFEKLYKDAYKAVYWTALTLLKNKETAEDVVQDTFITAYNSYDTLKDKDKAVTWVKRIAANKCLDILRGQRTLNVEDEFFEDTEAVGEDFLPESLVESEEKRKILMDILQKCLSEETYVTIVLFYFNDLSADEIGERLGISSDSVFSRLSYARKKIKKEVEKYEEDNHDKLFAIMGVPFLKLLFERESESVPFKPMPTSLQKIPASHATKGAVKLTATDAVSKGGKILMIKKLAIGALAVTLVGGCGIVVYKIHKEKQKEPKHLISTIPEESKSQEETTDTDDQDTAHTVTVEDEDDLITIDDMDMTGAYYVDEYRYTYYDDTDTHMKSTLYVPEYGKVSETVFSTSGNDTTSWSDFNKDKKAVRYWYKKADGSTYTCSEYEYTEDGNFISICYDMNNDHTALYTIEETLDDQGRVLTMVDTNVDGHVTRKVEFTYEADGSYYCYTETPSSEGTNISESWTDKNGNPLKHETTFASDGRVISTVYYYDEDGKRTRSEELKDGELDQYRLYSYEGSWDDSYTSYRSYNPDGELLAEYRLVKTPYESKD